MHQQRQFDVMATLREHSVVCSLTVPAKKRTTEKFDLESERYSSSMGDAHACAACPTPRENTSTYAYVQYTT